MTLLHPIQTRFNSGELSSLCEGRVDGDFLPILQASWREGLNVIGLPQGPAQRRPGTRFVAEIADSAAAGRLLPFRFSAVQAYQIECGDAMFRFYRNKARIDIAATDAAITNGDFPSGITGWTDRSNGTGAISHDATNLRMNLAGGGSGNEAIAEQAPAVTTTSVEHVLRFRLVGDAGARDAITLRVGSTSGGTDYLDDLELTAGWHAIAFTPSASPFYIQFENGASKTVAIDDVSLIDDAPMQVGTPWATADLAALKIAQSNDVLYLVHPSYRPYRLERRGHTTWSVAELGKLDGPYLDDNAVTAATLTPAATGGSTTVTASADAAAQINGGQGFLATDIGRLVSIKHSSTWGYGTITARASATQVTVRVISDFAATTASSDWRLGLWSDTDGWPGAAAFYKQRLGFFGAGAAPNRADLSKAGDFEVFTPGSNDADPVAATPDTDGVDAILWALEFAGRLILGTAAAELSLGKSSATSAFGPANVEAPTASFSGCADVPPLRAETAILFLQAQALQLHELGANIQVDGLDVQDLTIRAEHVTGAGLTELAFQRTPWPVAWAVRADGQLCGLTYIRKEGVIGWHRHVLGGAFGGGAAAVESVSVIPGATQDELWMIVKRTVDGATKRYVEFMEAPHRPGDAQADAFCVDCGLVYSGAAATTLTGLGHLEGLTVSVLGDGADHGTHTVTSGAVTLTRAVTKAVVGLPAPWRLKPQRIEADFGPGTAQARTKQIDKVGLRFVETLGVRTGKAFGATRQITFRAGDADMGSPPALFTGDKIVDHDGNWETDGDFVLEGDQPFPMTLLCILNKTDVQEV